MNDLHNLIEQMVTDISSQTVQLDVLRLRLFLNWLNAHSSRIKIIADFNEQDEKQNQINVAFNRARDIQERLKTCLRIWFESLPVKGLLWEYHLILDEIAWWRDLDPRRLTMILESEEKQGDDQTFR